MFKDTTLGLKTPSELKNIQKNQYIIFLIAYCGILGGKISTISNSLISISSFFFKMPGIRITLLAAMVGAQSYCVV